MEGCDLIRWCRFAQPPANGSDPFGVGWHSLGVRLERGARLDLMARTPSGWAGMPSGCGLNARRDWILNTERDLIRWCRFAQPPANGSRPLRGGLASHRGAT